MTDNLGQQLANYSCTFCNYTCYKKYDWERHILTRKHKINETNKTNIELNLKTENFNCICGKKYKHRQSLFTHKKTCNINNQSKNNNTNMLVVQNNILNNLITAQSKQIIELQNLLCKNSF
jgi:hypothetical protein